MKPRNAHAHMQAAYVYAELSYCVRRQVGCVIVKNDSIIAIGYNGTPAGDENVCENDLGETKPTVIHAEDNALRKLTKQYESAVGSVAFVTTAPCKPCAVRLADAGVTKVYYDDMYRCVTGIDYLESRGVETEQLHVENNNNNKEII